MPDPTLSIAYSITSITSNYDGTSNVTYTMSHSGTGLSSTRTDTFSTAALANGVNTTTDSTPTKTATLQLNFEALANIHFVNFAVKVRAAQATGDVSNLDNATGTVGSLSLESLVAIHGVVII